MLLVPELPKNLHRRTIVVTGSSSGIGFHLAKLLLEKFEIEKIVIHGRSQSKLDQVVERLGAKDKVVAIAADFADLNQVKAFAERVERDLQVVDMLFLNAGMSYGGFDGDSISPSSGMDVLYTSNVLAPFILAKRLLPLVEKSSLPGRIAWTSSVLAYYGDPYSLSSPPKYDGSAAAKLKLYADSKLAVYFIAAEMAKRMKETNKEVIVQAFAPGMVRSNISVATPNKRNELIDSHLEESSLVERRFDTPQGAMYTLLSIFAATPEEEWSQHLLGPYRIPSIFMYLPALSLWVLENFQKVTAVPNGLYLWPKHPVISDESFRKKLWYDFEKQAYKFTT